MRITSVRLAEDELAALTRLAELEDRSVSWLIRAAVREYLAEHDSAAPHEDAPHAPAVDPMEGVDWDAAFERGHSKAGTSGNYEKPRGAWEG